MTANTVSVWTSRALTTTSVSVLRATGEENKWFLVFKYFQSKSWKIFWQNWNIFSGKRCEYLTSLSFLHNTSYVELEPLNVKPGESRGNISWRIKYFLEITIKYFQLPMWPLPSLLSNLTEFCFTSATTSTSQWSSSSESNIFYQLKYFLSAFAANKPPQYQTKLG